MKKNKKKSDFTVLWKLFSLYAKNHAKTIVTCVFCSLVSGFRPYVLIILSGVLIDGLMAGMDFEHLFLYLAGGLIANGLLQILDAWLRESFNSQVENCMEKQNFDMNEQSMAIDYENLENPAVQEKKRRQEQVVNVQGGMYWMLIWPLNRGLTGLVGVITAISVAIPLFTSGVGKEGMLYFWLSILLIAVIAACAYGSYKNSKYWNKRTKKLFDGYADSSRVSNYILHHILFGSETGKDLRIFKQQELLKEGMFGKEEESMGFLKKIRGARMKQGGLEATFSIISCGMVYLYAAMKAYAGLITVGSVVKYATSVIKCVEGLKYILITLSNWRQAVDYGTDYLDYMELENEKADGEEHIKVNSNQEILLECEHVFFRYPGSKENVIRDLNLSLRLNPGDHLAIVGRNGSGKTTFIKLLCRLYDVTEGSIRINGKDIREYDYEEYMRLFSVVFQDYRIFSLKLGENIAASKQVDEKRAKEALEKAGFDERFGKLKDGLDTYVGKEFEEDGVNVSGGERQKLAIARAIYKNSPFVIMDEPTAALDPISECDVYEGFDKLVGDKAAIYISHRLASCRFCSSILVFDSGNVIQSGSHEALLQQEGIYREMWNAQAQYYNV